MTQPPGWGSQQPGQGAFPQQPGQGTFPPQPGQGAYPQQPGQGAWQPGPGPFAGPPGAPGPYPPAPGGYGGPPPPAWAPPGFYYDPESGLTLPEGARLASAGRRIGAYFLGILLFIVTLGIGWMIWGLIVWGNGQTPALQVLGMRCWRPETGRVAGWGWMALREIVGRIIEGVLSFVTALLSLILMLATRDRKSLHDLIAGTVVLHDPGKVLVGERHIAAAQLPR
jgi:uncharacterized RDD family membrane protein YckC